MAQLPSVQQVVSVSRAVQKSDLGRVLDEEGKRIKNQGAAALITVALLADLVQSLQLIPGLGFLFIAPAIAAVVFGYVFIIIALKFFFDGIELIGGQYTMMKGGALIVSALVEFVPFISAFPAITPGVVAIIIATRLEDIGKERLIPTTKEVVGRAFQSKRGRQRTDELYRARFQRSVNEVADDFYEKLQEEEERQALKEEQKRKVRAF